MGISSLLTLAALNFIGLEGIPKQGFKQGFKQDCKQANKQGRIFLKIRLNFFTPQSNCKKIWQVKNKKELVPVFNSKF